MKFDVQFCNGFLNYDIVFCSSHNEHVILVLQSLALLHDAKVAETLDN